ncbi:MAG: hypothetical protein WC848_05530 [Parcubacteria group bacterium]|jgi:hypothetical protein
MSIKNLKLKIFFLAIIFCGVFGVARNSLADTHTAGSCSLADVTTAYNAASTGDTIAFPVSGACTWSSALTVGKAVTILGNETTLTAGGTMPNGFFNITGFTASSLVRITDFTFQMVNATPEAAIFVHEMQGGISGGEIRIDNNIFHFGSKPILFDHLKGLIDHNYFYNPVIGVEFSSGSRTNADASWSSLAAGTSDALYVEDNHFVTNASYTLGYTQEQIATFNGGKLVVRHNEFDADDIPDEVGTYTPFMAHGSADGGCGGAGYWEAGSCQRRGQSVIEFYNNVEHGKRIDFMFLTRGSANLIFNNSITGTVQYNPRIYFQEEEYYSDNWSILRTAWPAEDQVHNSFMWNNTYRGADFNDGEYGYVEASPHVSAGLLQDRDFFLHAPCAAGDTTDGYGNVCTHGKETFTGANGASASYPTDGSVYPNAGNMVFTATGDNAYLGYAPYTYPHPLQGEADTVSPTAPSGLSVE